MFPCVGLGFRVQGLALAAHDPKPLTSNLNLKPSAARIERV